MTTASHPEHVDTARPGGRAPDQLRPFTLEPGFLHHADASVLVSCGLTRVLCTASVDERVPRWMHGTGLGWVTAEYDMLPASTGRRRERDARKGRLDGRTVEISRLIGRSLRAVVDRQALGERTITVDCDVIDADGGTRCAAISGAWVALRMACDALMASGVVTGSPLTGDVQAVSVGVVGGGERLDLEYVEDAAAEVDMNVVMADATGFVEVQAAGEGATFSREAHDRLVDLAVRGCRQIREAQLAAVGAS